MGLVFRPDAGHMPEPSIDSDHQDWLAVFNQQVGVFAGAVWVTGVFAQIYIIREGNANHRVSIVQIASGYESELCDMVIRGDETAGDITIAHGNDSFLTGQ